MASSTTSSAHASRIEGRRCCGPLRATRLRLAIQDLGQRVSRLCACLVDRVFTFLELDFLHELDEISPSAMRVTTNSATSCCC